MEARSLILLLAAVVVACFVARARSSAIPMWEFLTREEKMSHLYRIFNQEVSEFCSESPMPDCNKNLLITGLKNLAHLDDDDLDGMDPYQRGAKDIIWRSIVGNSSGRQHEASRLGQHSFHTTEDDPLVGDNQLTQESTSNKDYAHPTEHRGPYLTGPMVIRVYPDGRPVPKEDQRPLPKDEDIEDIRSASQLPTIVELESGTDKAQIRVPSTAILPPRKRPNGRNYGPWFYPRVARPNNNNLLVRERFY
ncbi:rhythmically expressed gene 5 protein isoform X2 [Copidosoma floridanum]|uniref:rhythmically expressed gene 5 protein isoform X2 n=1 Tax=Copidosoma floridanum TaxID=29053 RepID=UPI0006C97C30|nr:rhythmically expressed gene 5 protein isoform X2 [Copidosoma floridanum]